MRYFLKLIILLSIICPIASFAQLTFVKSANLNALNFGQCLSPTSDGGYVISGQDKLFIQPANSFCQSYVVKIDSCNNIAYRVNFEHNGSPRIKSLGARHVMEGPTPNKFLITGTLIKQSGATHMYCMQVDVTSGVDWINQFVNTSNGDAQGASATKVNGGYIVCGFVDAEPKKPYIAKIDLNGNLLWDKAFTSLAGMYSYANFAQEFPNGDVLVLGSYGAGASNNFFAMRLSSTGTILWSKEYDVAQFDGQDWDVSGKILSGASTFVISGSTKQGGDYNSVMMKIDATTGSLLNTVIINNTGQDDRGRSVTELSNGNIVQVGYTADLLGTNTYVLMNCVSPNLTHLWSRTMTLNNYSKAWSIIEKCDKSLLFSGETFDGTNYNSLFVRTDDFGNVYNCNYSQTPIITSVNTPAIATNLVLGPILNNYHLAEYPANEFGTTPAAGGFVDACNFYRDTFIVNKTSVCIGDTFKVIVRKVNCVPNSINVVGSTNGNTILPYKITNHIVGLDTTYYVIPSADDYQITYSTYHGCTPYTDTKHIIAHPSPIVNITSSPSICQNDKDTLYAHVTSGTAPFNYTWQGIGTNINSDIIPLNTNAPMPVTVTVSDAYGCKSADARYYLENNPVPQPFITADAVCLNSTTGFQNNSVIGGGVISSYNWSFFDSANTPTVTSNLISPTNLYASCTASNFAKLIATSDKGCKDSLTIPITVYCNPTANFISDSVCLGSATTLTDASNGNGHPLISYSWDFYSNTILNNTGQGSLSYQFSNYGNTSVNYTVYSAPTSILNCNNIITKNVWVNPNPIPAFSLANKCINEQPILYNASASTIPIGSIANYDWKYGDAITGTGVNSSHTYVAAGIYQPTLVATSTKGCKAFISSPVEIYEKPYPIIFNSSTCDKKAMSFTATALPNSGHIDFWQWDVNNSMMSFELNGPYPKYIFPSPGTKTVSLVTTTNKGCKDTLAKEVYVNYLPVPLFVVDNSSGCFLPHCVKFTDQTQAITQPAKNINWTWYYGDGSAVKSTVDSIQPHCYSNFSSSDLAYYSVKLIVTTDSGCVDSISHPNMITVYPKPFADFTINPDPGNVVTPLEYFTNTSKDYTKWWWNFNDKSPIDSTHLNPTHFYDNVDATTYNVILMVSNQYGCRDTAVVPLVVGPEFVFYIPNAFTPENEDGVNDNFTGQGIGIAEYEMWIFDRWGSQIYYSDDIRKGWNGKVQGKDTKCQQDVYVWRVSIKDVLSKKHHYVGHVTLLR